MKPFAGRPGAVSVTSEPAATVPVTGMRTGVVHTVLVPASPVPPSPASPVGGDPPPLLPQPVTAKVHASVPTTASEARGARLAINADQRPESLRVIFTCSFTRFSEHVPGRGLQMRPRENAYTV